MCTAWTCQKVVAGLLIARYIVLEVLPKAEHSAIRVMYRCLLLELIERLLLA